MLCTDDRLLLVTGTTLMSLLLTILVADVEECIHCAACHVGLD